MESIGTYSPATAHEGFAARLLGTGPGAEGMAKGVLRTLSGSSLACAFGLACCSRELWYGGGFEVGRAAGRVLAMASPPLIFALGFGPALWVLLTLFGRSVDGSALAAAATRTTAAVGLALGGLAPAAALFELTAADSSGVGLAKGLELVFAFVSGLVGLRVFVLGVHGSLAPAERDGVTYLLLAAFCLLGLLLGGRLWIPTILGLDGGFHDC